MRDYTVKNAERDLEITQGNTRVYQKQYRNHEKWIIKNHDRDGTHRRGQEDDSGGFLQNLAMGLNNTGNVFNQPSPEEPGREDERSSREGREKSGDRRRDYWRQLF